jgi:hypothetical protein
MGNDEGWRPWLHSVAASRLGVARGGRYGSRGGGVLGLQERPTPRPYGTLAGEPPVPPFLPRIMRGGFLCR